MSSSDLNPRVSNGTCYTASGKKLDSSFIPCGNDAFGRQTCCGKGDNCLADGACFGVHGEGYGGMLTYWAGCSDPVYEDASCPKKVVDQPWVALTYCKDSGEWAICSQIGNPSTLQNGAYCECTDSAKATPAFKDSQDLDRIVSLPQNTGDTLSFFQGHSPAATVPTAGATGGGGGGGGQATKTGSRTLETSTTTTAPPSSPPAGTTTPSSSSSSPMRSSDSSSSGSSATTAATTFTDASGRTTTATVTRTAVSPGDTNTGSSGGSGNGNSDAESSGLNTGAKIGVGVGVAVGGVLLIALVLLLLRRRRNRPAKRMEDDGFTPPSEPKVPLADSAAIVEADGRPAKPHKLRGELGEEGAVAAAGRRPSTKLKSKHQQRASGGSTASELEGSVVGAAGAGTAGAGTAHQPSVQQADGEGLTPVAELPGGDVQSGNQGRLASDDSLVPAPLQLHRTEEGTHAAPPVTTSGPSGAGAATGGMTGQDQHANQALHDGAQVKPWGARWRRT